MVFLHVHERRVMIRPAVAVPVSADMDIRNILLVFRDPVFCFLGKFLQNVLVISFPVYEADVSFPALCFQPFLQLLQLPQLHRLPNMKSDSRLLQQFRQFGPYPLIQPCQFFYLTLRSVYKELHADRETGC